MDDQQVQPIDTTNQTQTSGEPALQVIMPATSISTDSIVDSQDFERLRLIIDVAVLIFCGIFGACLYFGGLYELFVIKQPWMVEILHNHFPALILPPLLMLGSIMVVSALRMTDGPMKLKFLILDFDGSAAPVIMWVLVYLVLLHSVQILWDVKL